MKSTILDAAAASRRCMLRRGFPTNRDYVSKAFEFLLGGYVHSSSIPSLNYLSFAL